MNSCFSVQIRLLRFIYLCFTLLEMLLWSKTSSYKVDFLLFLLFMNFEKYFYR